MGFFDGISKIFGGGGNPVGQIIGSVIGARSANKATDRLTENLGRAMGVQQDVYRDFQKDISPYQNVGDNALMELYRSRGGGVSSQDFMRAVLGHYGQAQQAKVYSDVAASPEMQAMQQAASDALLANASATGGLRGGNVASAQMKIAPQILQALMEQKYSRSQQMQEQMNQNQRMLAGMGLQATGMSGQAGQNYANAMQGLHTGVGQAGYEGQLAKGTYLNQGINAGMNLAQQIAGLPQFGGAPKANPNNLFGIY